MKIHLKIKSAYLSEEVRIIKNYERRLAKRIARAQRAGKTSFAETELASIQEHRRKVVSMHARAAHLALAFWNGTSYVNAEGHGFTKTSDIQFLDVMKFVQANVDNFCRQLPNSHVLLSRFEIWRKNAELARMEMMRRKQRGRGNYPPIIAPGVKQIQKQIDSLLTQHARHATNMKTSDLQDLERRISELSAQLDQMTVATEAAQG